MRAVLRFWGIPEAPKPEGIIRNEELVEKLGEGRAGALFDPDRKLIIVPKKDAFGLEGEFTHWLRYALVGKKEFHRRVPVEEMLEHIAMLGLNRRQPLPEKARRQLELVSLKTLETLVSVYKYVREAERKYRKQPGKESKKVADMLAERADSLHKIMRALVHGETIDPAKAYMEMDTALNLARMFLDKEPVDALSNVGTVLLKNAPDIEDAVKHWPYILAEHVVERVKRMSPKERRRFFERAHEEFRDIVIDYLRKHRPELAEEVERLVPRRKARGERIVNALRWRINFLRAKLRGNTIRA